MEAQQSNAEVFRIAKDWEELYAPVNLIRDDRTARLLLDWVLDNEQIASFSGFNHAVAALGAQVLYPDAPPLKVKSADELAAEGNARMDKEYQDSLKPQVSWETRVKVETAKRQAEEAAKVQVNAKGRLRTLIDSYECYKTNGAGKDFPSTEMVRQELRGLKCGNDFVRAVAELQQILQELPDHPRQGDVARVVASLNARLK
jgi:hypothetical protein